MHKTDTAMTLERDGAIAHLRFTRPDRANAMTVDFWRELPQWLGECGADSRVRVLVVSAEGRNFSGGMDLQAFRLMERGRHTVEGSRWRANFRNNVLRIQADVSLMESVRFPVIAAVQGACLGAAVDLLCACDVRYASNDAYMTVHETNIGIMPDGGTLPRLARLMPDGVVRELVFSGRRMPAEEAQRYGFFNRLFPDAAAVLTAAMQLAGEIAAKSPHALWGSKEMLNYGRDHTTADTLRYIAAWQAGAISFDDVETSIVAQRAKAGAPRFDDVHLTRHLFDDGSGD